MNDRLPTASQRKTVKGSDFPPGLKSRPIVIQSVYPELDGGRYPVKREVGDVLTVEADVFTDGHGKLAAILKHRAKDEAAWTEVQMTCINPGLDRWQASFPLTRNIRHVYTIEAWNDLFAYWSDGTAKKKAAQQNVEVELIEGKILVEGAVKRAKGEDASWLKQALERFAAAKNADARYDILQASELRLIMDRWPDRSQSVVYDHELEVTVDRVRVRFAAWYEMFQRSQGTVAGKGSTFADCATRLPEVRAMGFDVVYFVPIHPIGRTHRKGRDNTLTAGPGDPGSPYAIGAAEGGHDAVHPELGTLADFRAFVAEAHKHEMEVALDFAIQCSPDHPWIKEHPEWFEFRPDGTIKYAENPPKKYQDIVNVNFYGPHQEALWKALRDVVLFWVEQGVKIFRVDNPHTKPVPFWEWMIGEVQAKHPDVMFLAEAFTRPPMLKMLAKVGFGQSYTYFTWRNFKHELMDYLTELTQTSTKEFLRPNFFANTPDILPEYLQKGGRPAFMIRLVLASTLSSVYGIYNGFELCENAAVPGTEEYLHSEKYEYKVWDWDRPGNIKDLVTTVNRVRRENPALHELDNLRFYHASDDNVLFYGKMSADKTNAIFIVVNLDPFDAHESEIEFPLHELGFSDADNFSVEELITGVRHLWHGAWHKIRLDPQHNPAMIFRLSRWVTVHHREPCF